MPYVTGQDLKNDVLFRSSESDIAGASDWNTKVMDYINRVYRVLCAGASEFMPETVENWWWLRSRSTLTLLPVTIAGTVTVTQGSANVSFSVAPSVSVVDYRLRVSEHPELFKIATHTAAANAATLDSVYTGPSGARSYMLMKTEYALAANAASLVSPMTGFRSNARIQGVPPERMDDLWPVSELTSGVPTMFALENEQLVRFNLGGRTDGQSMRVEYMYRPQVVDIVDSPSSIPLVPLEYRHLIADMALPYMFRDKSDSRGTDAVASARTGLLAMVKEHKRRVAKMNDMTGRIFPRGDMRQNLSGKGPLRTDTGLIIG